MPNKRTRRDVVRTTVGLGGLGLTGLLASGTGAAKPMKKGSEGYLINEDGFLEYHGSKDDEYIFEAVEGMNKAKRNGEANFVMKDGQVIVEDVPTITRQDSCAGQNGYNGKLQYNGYKHTFKLDHCNTRELIDLLIAGAAVSQVAALLTAATGNVPAALVVECAAIILAAGWQIIDNNNEGEGVEVVFFLPNVIGVPGVNPQ